MTAQTTKLAAAFLIGTLFMCSIQYFCPPAAKWWSRAIYDCGVRVAHGTKLIDSTIDLSGQHHWIGVCYD
jgi:hypothetical protein